MTEIKSESPLGACEMVFGKKKANLTSEELKVFRQAVRTASYYRDHERGKKWNRRNKQFMKRDIIKALGLPERCLRCGYDKYIGALDFHHRDPTQKEFEVGKASFEISVEEARKCDLLCANCHREVHAEMPRQRKGGRPRLALHPQVAAYLDAVGVERPPLGCWCFACSAYHEDPAVVDAHQGWRRAEQTSASTSAN